MKQKSKLLKAPKNHGDFNKLRLIIARGLFKHLQFPNEAGLLRLEGAGAQ